SSQPSLSNYAYRPPFKDRSGGPLPAPNTQAPCLLVVRSDFCLRVSHSTGMRFIVPVTASTIQPAGASREKNSGTRKLEEDRCRRRRSVRPLDPPVFPRLKFTLCGAGTPVSSDALYEPISPGIKSYLSRL